MRRRGCAHCGRRLPSDKHRVGGPRRRFCCAKHAKAWHNEHAKPRLRARQKYLDPRPRLWRCPECQQLTKHDPCDHCGARWEIAA